MPLGMTAGAADTRHLIGTVKEADIVDFVRTSIGYGSASFQRRRPAR
jgi:hypothetical protein